MIAKIFAGTSIFMRTFQNQRFIPYFSSIKSLDRRNCLLKNGKLSKLDRTIGGDNGANDFPYFKKGHKTVHFNIDGKSPLKKWIFESSFCFQNFFVPTSRACPVWKQIELENCQLVNYFEHVKVGWCLPLLVPSGPLRMVHSSIPPKGCTNWRTSSSVCCLLSMPTNSLRSSEISKKKKCVINLNLGRKIHCYTVHSTLRLSFYCR